MSFRQLKLELVLALRSASWFPWVLLVGWIGVCRLQEPPLFRYYGIFLTLDGAWFLTGALCVMFFAVGRIQNGSVLPAVAADFALLLMVGMGIVAIDFTLQSITAVDPAAPWPWLAEALLGWAPLAAIAPGLLPAGPATGAGVLRLALVALGLVLLGCFSLEDTTPWSAKVAGSVLATGGSLMLSLHLAAKRPLRT